MRLLRAAGDHGGDGPDFRRGQRRCGGVPLPYRHRRGIDHGEAGGAEQRQRNPVGGVPPPSRRRARHHRGGAARGRRGLSGRDHDHRHHRIGRPASVPVARCHFRAGGHRVEDGGGDLHPQNRRRHRVGRRGREDHLLRQRYRAAHERHLRRRHGRLHRPDGGPSGHGCRRPERAGGRS